MHGPFIPVEGKAGDAMARRGRLETAPLQFKRRRTIEGRALDRWDCRWGGDNRRPEDSRRAPSRKVGADPAVEQSLSEDRDAEPSVN